MVYIYHVHHSVECWISPPSGGHGHKVREVTSSHEHPTQAPDIRGPMVTSKGARVGLPRDTWVNAYLLKDESIIHGNKIIYLPDNMEW